MDPKKNTRRKWITGSAITRIEKMHACMHPRWHLFFYRICTRPWALLDTLRTRVDRSTGFHWEGSQGKKYLSSSKLTNEFLTLPPPSPIIQEWLVLIHIFFIFLASSFKPAWLCWLHKYIWVHVYHTIHVRVISNRVFCDPIEPGAE